MTLPLLKLDDFNQTDSTFDLLGFHTENGFDLVQDRLVDSIGRTETLYQSSNGRLFVEVKEWSTLGGGWTKIAIFEVTLLDLWPGGRFEALGAETGFGRPAAREEETE